MRFDVLTLFPDMINAALGDSIIGRAQSKGIIEINCVDIRDFAGNKHNRVDDAPYGGGRGMVIQSEPVFRAYESVARGLDEKPFTVYLSPQGRVFRESTAKRLSKKERVILICGHYEGIDQRVLDEIVDEEISIGDFVMTGGEIAAMAVIDATSRLIDGVLPDEEAYLNESLSGGLLEHPQYTRPPVWHGVEVPEVLRGGNHKMVADWKREQSIINTFNKRRGMLSRANLTEEEKVFVAKLKK